MTEFLVIVTDGMESSWKVVEADTAVLALDGWRPGLWGNAAHVFELDGHGERKVFEVETQKVWKLDE